MVTQFLKFPDKATGMQILENAGLTGVRDSEVFVVTDSHHHSLDVVGEITKDDVKLEGWHINFRGNIPEEWTQYLVHPDTPARDFF